jgi:hypothetical protein
VPGRDIFVQAWYQGGISVIDFTDTANPVEIAFFDRGPVNPEELTMGGYWSVYWYDGRIYGTEIARGLDVLELVPSEHLSANEIAAAGLALDGDLFNPQTQFALSWPHEPVVARAYIDQLERADALPDELAGRLDGALGEAEAMLASGRGDGLFAERLAATAGKIADSAALAEGTTRKRMAALAETVEGIATRLSPTGAAGGPAGRAH